MSFLLRAALVVGALSYLALESREAVEGSSLASRSIDLKAMVPNAWNALPEEARQRIVKEGASELSRRLSDGAGSNDTLAASDRRPHWRGVTRD